jgi:hypothetical protein
MAQGRSATTASMAAPIGGWNARDSLAEMNPLDAVQMVNFFPTPTDVQLRKGWTKFSTGITGNVDTLINYPTSTGIGYKLFAFAGDKIYDATSSTATVVFSGLSNAIWQYVNISTTGGDFVIAVNGVDPALIYDGTSWAYMATTQTAQTISTITRGGTGNLTATVTTASPHNLVTGNRITASGASPAEYNGTFVITKTGASTFTYKMASAPATNATVVGSYTITGITGVNSNTFVNVNLFKNRLYFCQNNSLQFWYLDVEAISGAATNFALGAFYRNGGYLQAMGTWTLDAGYGVDDFAVFVTSMGEILVYQGFNPSDPANWAMKGLWQMGQTFARRCFFKWGGDLLLLTQDGLVPLTAALQSDRLDPRINLTDKIFYAVSLAASQYATNFGWQIQYMAAENMLILSIPTNDGMEQYVMHTITKSWARFTGIQAYCWCVSGDQTMHFGGQGFVGSFYDSFSDNGTNIVGNCQQAYSYFDSRGQQKRFTLVRPILQTDNGLPTVLCGISTDFDTQPLTNQISFNPSIINTGIWDTSKWDQANWGGGLVTTKNWQGVSGLGFSGSINMNVASQGIEFHWASTDYVMERGGVL